MCGGICRCSEDVLKCRKDAESKVMSCRTAVDVLQDCWRYDKGLLKMRSMKG